jgi:hypothetical protein
VKRAYDLANGKYTAATATSTVQGLVKFNNSTSDTSTDVACSAAAVKSAFDLASSKYTSANASLINFGIVKLYNDNNSNAIDLAATANAVMITRDLAQSASNTAINSSNIAVIALRNGGPVGPTGPTGPQGPQGLQGATGPQGATGTFSGTTSQNVTLQNSILYVNNTNSGSQSSTSMSGPIVSIYNHSIFGDTLPTVMYLSAKNTTTDTTIRTWTIAIELTASTSKALYFTSPSNQSSYIAGDRRGLLNFTGQHRCLVKSKSLSDIKLLLGLIVVANQNKYIRMTDGIAYGHDAITMNECLPIVDICTSSNNKAVLGVISSAEDDNRHDAYGSFCTVFEKPKGDTRAYINSVGEGAIWVCDINGNLESGDYVTSSAVPGYGMKQQNDAMMNYTVAKITMDCDFSAKYSPKLVPKTVVVEVTETTKAKEIYEDVEYNVEYDEVLQRYIRHSKVVQKERDVFEYVTFYDSNGRIIGTEKKNKMVSCTTIKEENDVDENGNIIWVPLIDDSGNIVMEYEYSMRYLTDTGVEITKAEYEHAKAIGNAVYKAAFVGCTYHCG